MDLAARWLLIVLVLTLFFGLYLWRNAAELSAQRFGKVLLFIGILVIPLGMIRLGVAKSIHDSESREFCMSCHEMHPFGKSLHVDDSEFIPAVHYQNHLVPPDQACYRCHADYSVMGTVKAKIGGLRHVWVHYFGTIPKTTDIKLYDPYPNSNCLSCHKGMRKFETNSHHDTKETPKAAIYSGKVSCLTRGCHDIAHGLDKHGLKDYIASDELDYWYWPPKKSAMAKADGAKKDKDATNSEGDGE